MCSSTNIRYLGCGGIIPLKVLRQIQHITKRSIPLVWLELLEPSTWIKCHFTKINPIINAIEINTHKRYVLGQLFSKSDHLFKLTRTFYYYL